jgi:hypothetical protein
MQCARVKEKFHKSVNMTPAAIRAWHKNPKSKLFSFQSTRDRLPALAALKAKSRSKWTSNDCRYAKRVINFNTRMGGAAKKNGCTLGYDVALRNWGRRQCNNVR